VFRVTPVIVSPPALAIEPFDGNGVAAGQPDRHRFRDTNAGLLCERHGRVLDERRVGRVAIAELDDPLLGVEDFESYRIWRADGWNRPPGTSARTGPGTTA